MRVSSNTFSNSLADQLGDLTSRQAKLQSQVSSGQRIQLAEDDPNAMQSVLNSQDEAKNVAQYKTNVSFQQNVADNSYAAITSLKTLSDRANEIATLAGGLKSSDELTTYANEVNDLIKQGVQTVNGKSNGSYAFGGTVTDQPPFVSGTDANGNVTSVTYQGNESVNQSEVGAGVTVSAQLIGANTSGSGSRGLITDSASGADFFNHLISLRDNLLAGNSAAVASNDQPALQNDENNLIYHIGLNGAVQSRLQNTSAGLDDRALALNSQVSNDASTNMAETAVRLTQAQTAYQAALQSSSKILSLSLMDYLK